MLSVNQVLQQGRYHITSQLEHEEAGTYQAFDNVLKTNVTIKETSFDLKVASNFNKYPIAKQIENLTSIEHESFTRVHGFFSEVEHQYLVTEAVEGQNLKEILEKNQKPFVLFTVLNWTEQLLNALNYLHLKIPPIIHRDINPSNLTLTKNNKIKLLTYPIIKEFSPQQSKKQGKYFSDLQLPYLPLEVLWETLDYASQKVILNSYEEESAEILESPIDERSDIYSLGATIYHLATGKAPTDALERSIDLLEGKVDPLINPSQLNPQLPGEVSAFLMKSLEIKRENRFESAAAMSAALQPMLDLMRKTTRETQKALDDPKVTEAALREVELARQLLRKQREESEQLKIRQAQQKTAEAENAAQQQLLAENERAKQTLAELEQERLLKIQEQERAAQLRLIQVEERGLEAKVRKQNDSFLVAEAENLKASKTEEKLSGTASDSLEYAAEPTKKPTSAAAENESVLFSAIEPERKGVSWLIPVICVVVVLVVGGFFGFKFLNSNNQPTPQPVVEQKVADEPNKVPEATKIQNEASTDSPVVSPANVQEPSDATLSSGDSEKDNESTIKAKRAATPVPQAEKKPAPANPNTPAPKKKGVTVDDIINDN